VRKHKRYFLKS